MKSAKNGLSIDFLVANLKASDQVVRLHAATVLGSLGDAAVPAVPALIELLLVDPKLSAERTRSIREAR